MKWIMICAAVATVIPANISMPSEARAQALPSSGLVDECKDNRYPGRTIGSCIGTQTVRAMGIPGTAPLQCDFLRDVFPDVFDTFWDSYEDCVQDLSAELRDPE